MEIQSLISDGALLLFSLAGLATTAVAIARDTRTQRAQLADISFES